MPSSPNETLRRRASAASIVVACGLWGCGVMQEDEGWFEAAAALHAAAPAEASSPRGIHGEPAAPLRTGDALEYEVVQRSGDERRRWLLRARIDPPPPGLPTSLRFTETVRAGDDELRFESALLPVHVELVDGSREASDDGATLLPTDLLANGFYDTCAARAEGRPVDSRAIHEISLCLSQLLEISQRVPALADVLWTVLRVPFAAIFGPDLAIEFDLSRLEPWRVRVPGREAPSPGYRFPIVLRLNGHVALECSMIVVPPEGALGLGAGIVSVIGVRPGDPDSTVELSLASVRRAPADTSR
jgi:hypothetical protein